MAFIIILLIYILIAFWIWKRKHQEKLGCILPVITLVIITAAAALSSVMFSLAYETSNVVFTHIIKGNISNIQFDEWISFIVFDILALVIVVGVFSFVGYKINGHQPKICKLLWHYLLKAIQLLLLLVLLALAFSFIYFIQLRLTTPKLDDMPIGFIILLFIFALVPFWGSVSLAAYLLYPHEGALDIFNPDEKQYTYRRLNKKEAETIDTKEGGEL